MDDKGMPSSLDAERIILGSILIDNEVFFDDIADLTTDDFYLTAHQMVFRVMNEILFGLVEGVRHVDVVTLVEELRKRKQLSTVGGIAWLNSLHEGLPRRLNCSEYAKIIKDKAKLRRVIEICSRAITRCADQSENYETINADIQDQLTAEAAESEGKATPIGEIMPSIVGDIEKNRSLSTDRAAAQLTWGLSGLDEMTHGVFPAEVTVLAAESGQGKTAMATQIVLANAREGTPCAIFSLEMTKKLLSRRFIPQMANGKIITADTIRDPRLMNSHTHVPELRRLGGELSKLPIWIDDSSPMPINRLVARARMMRRKLGIRLLLVDYYQLIKRPEKVNFTEGYEMVAMALRELMKAEPELAIIVLSQYSKGEGIGKRKKRSRGDLYGGQVIHHAAQNVVLMNVESPENKDKNELLDAEFIIDKQREGRKGKVSCMYDRDALLFVHPQPVLNT